MSTSSPRPPRRRRYFWRDLRLRFYAGEVARELNYAVDMSDRALDVLDDRVARLEEVIAARWPRSIVLKRRLRRELRESVAGYDDHVPPGFRGRRLEWAGEQVILSAMRFRELHEGKRGR